MLLNKLIEKIEAINEVITNIIIIIVGCQNIILVNINNSLIRLMDGGAEMLIAKNINHQNVRLGKIFVNPLIDIIFRVWNLEYVILTNKNRAAEDNPWANIMIIAPFSPRGEKVNNAAKTIPMWATEE